MFEGLEYEHHKRDKHMETCFLCVIFGSIWIGLQNQLIASEGNKIT